MMIEYPANSWGRTGHGGETSRHAFCFGDYFAPDKLGFGALRVMNESRLAASHTWQTLRRANMEIVTLMLAGSLLQRDANGNEIRLQAGQVQCMSAGRGMEYQQRAEADAHFWQFWIQPTQVNAEPRICVESLPNSPVGWASLPTIAKTRQDVGLHFARLASGEYLQAAQQAGRRYWLQIMHGEIQAHGKTRHTGDALAWQAETTALEIRNTGMETAQLLLLELPGQQ